MNVLRAKCPHPKKAGEPVWDLARFYPAQGYWTEEDYLELDRAGMTLVEFTDGFVEVLPRPTCAHQGIVCKLLLALAAFTERRKLGEALPAPLPLRLRQGMWRQPDIVLIPGHGKPKGDYPERASLVVEVVSKGTTARARDYQRKPADYAAAGVPEYWIVDPQAEQITVLSLRGRRYAEHGVFKKGQRATSVLLKGFGMDVTAVFEAAK